METIFRLKQSIEKYKEKKRNIAIVYTDFEEAW